MEPQEIKSLLKEVGIFKNGKPAKGMTQTDIARELDVSQVAVWLVIHKKGVSKKIQDHICFRIGKTFEEVWE